MPENPETANPVPRDHRLDLIRGGILVWVVIVHAVYWTNYLPYRFVTAKSFMLVEMPILFFVSGAAAGLSTAKDPLSYLSGRFSRILVPYWGFAAVALFLSIRDSLGSGFPYPFTEWAKWLIPYNLPANATDFTTWHLWFIRSYLAVMLLVPLFRAYRGFAERCGRGYGRYLTWLPLVLSAVGLWFTDAALRHGSNPGSLLPYVFTYSIWTYLGMGWGKPGLGLGINPAGWKRLALSFLGAGAAWGLLYLLRLRGIYTLDMQINKFPPNSAFLLYQVGLFCIYPLLVPTITGLLGNPRLKWLMEPYSRYGYTIYLFHALVFLFLRTLTSSLGWWGFMDAHPWLALGLWIPAAVVLSLAVVPPFRFLEEYGGRAFRDRRFMMAMGSIAVAIGIGYFLEYYGKQGSELARYPAFNTFNTVFGSDIPRVIDDLTNIMGNHYRTKVHPLFVLFTNPTGSGLAATLGNAAAAIRMTNAMGTATLVLAFAYLMATGTGFIGASLLTLVLGFSAGMTVWSSVPETFVYGSATLVLAHLASLGALRYGKGRLTALPVLSMAALPLAAIPVLGITTTNYLQAVVLAVVSAIAVSMRMKWWKGTALTLGYTMVFLLVSLSVSIRLSDLQKDRYPSTMRFYLSEAYDEEHRYTHWENLREPVRTLGTLGRVLFLYSVVPPEPITVPAVEPYGAYSLAFETEGVPGYDAKSWMALIGWVGLLLGGAVAGWRRFRPQFIALVACIGLNLGIHSVYGTDEVFLYTAHNLFLLIGVAGFAVAEIRRFPPVPRIIGYAALVLIAWQVGIRTSEFMGSVGTLLYGMQ